MPTLRPPSDEPAAPRLPDRLNSPEEPLEQLDGAFQLALDGADFSGADLAEAEIEQCRLGKVSLSGAVGSGTTLIDCLIEQSDLANVVLEGSGLRRVVVADSRLTGLTFIDGMVRDVVFR
ncbi:MAG TPA: hypothetical protein DGT23_35835, partial [Micromonosporaceae bacterium]|nr:hypothetical protein [Micromonosporaceae bacterium]